MAVIPPTPTEDTDLRSPKPDPRRLSAADGAPATHRPESDDPDAPVSFIPHEPLEATVPPRAVRIRTGRYGELEEHELVRLLDSIEDERARARFRESVYISVFVWMAIALIALFGPKYLWHAPRVVLPSEVLRQRELTQLTAPRLEAPRLRSAPPALDNRTLEHLRSAAPKPVPTPAAPAPTPAPATPEASPRTAPKPLPAAPTPNLQPSNVAPNLPATPAPQPAPPRPAPPVVADAPRPQPSSKPDFSQTPRSAGDAIQDAIRNAPRAGGGGGGGVASRNRGGAEVGMGPAEILSDTQGVNFNPYLQRILREIYDQWLPLIPEEARPPLMKSGVTMIRFTILPDGTIGAMNLDGSTHDDALNKAAWGSITGVGQFPALPSQFHGPNLELRIHYLVNRQSE